MDSYLRAWFRRAARFKALEAVRQRKKAGGTLPLDDAVIEKLEENWVHYDTMPESDFCDLIDMLRECMRLLTPMGRRLLVMRYAKELRTGEIARRLKSKVESIYQAISRAHRSLANCVQQKLAAKSKETPR